MAVSLTSQPQDKTYVGLGVEYVIALSDAGTDPIEKRMFYELLGPSGVVGKRKVCPFVPGGVPVDFANSIKPLFPRGFINVNSTSITDIASWIEIEVSLRYGEYEYNKETTTQTETSSATSATRKILRMFPRFNEGQGLPIDKRWLNTKPDRFTVYGGQHDWICVTGGGTLNVTLYNGDNEVFTGTHSVSGYQAIPIGGANFYTGWTLGDSRPFPDNFTGGRLNYNGVEKSFGIKGCGKGGEILFRDPAGGFNSIFFENVEGAATRTAETYTAHSRFESSGATRAETGGVTEIRPMGGESLKFSTEIINANIEGMNAYVGALAAAPEHYVLTKDQQTGATRLTKFILDNAQISGSRTRGKSTLSASGRIARQIKL